MKLFTVFYASLLYLETDHWQEMTDAPDGSWCRVQHKNPILNPIWMHKKSCWARIKDEDVDPTVKTLLMLMQ